MATILNADNGVVSGISGLTTSADNSGILQFQTSGTATLEISTAGNINIPGTGKRITGDFTNTTIANRVLFQSSTTNGQTSIGALPNGTSTTTNLNLFGGTDPANASIAQWVMNGSEARIGAIITGTGTYLPLTMYTGGSERLRIDTSGNVGIGTSSPSAKLTVSSGSIRLSDGYEIGWGDNSSYIVGNGTSDTLQFVTAAAERMRIDSSGQLGLGCTPSVVGSAAGYRAFYLGTASGSGLLGNGSDTYLLCNAYYDAAWKAVASANVSAYQLSGTTHYWRSAANPGAGATLTWTNVMTLDKDQTLSLQGASTGVSGTGITFPATQSASSNANTLDDYEEGSWTPTPGNGSLAILNARYIKIGKLVVAEFWVQSFSTVTSSIISGLPFTSASNYYSPSVVHTNANIVNVARVAQSSNNVVLLNFSDTQVALNTFGGFAIATVCYESAS